MAPAKLRDLIKAVRGTKTAQEEREVIAKECASIRDGFRKDDADSRARNVGKLLYVHMLGYPAHFGQMECLKLVTSNKFNDKRIGYLGAMMLLDELKDVHMLITNSLKNDLNHAMQYVAGLALCTLGTICSVDMARDLSHEIEKLLKSTNSYVRKKAVLCAVRIIRKVPDLMENFIPATRALLGERNHGVLITGVTLINEICLVSPENLGHFRRLVPTLVRLLKNLVMTGYSPEHDVSGVTDPFLQCKIIRLLKVLCKGDQESSDSVNDILAQVATNTDTTKTVGNAILYEAVMCIMDIHAESGLRVLAINSLGKFLQNADRNIQYVALTTLLSIVENADSFDAVQRHRGTIIDCLSQPDITIRKRALVLIFALITQSNIESLIKELVEYLTLADAEYRGYMVKEIFAAALKFPPNRKWHVDTLLAVLERAAANVPDELIPQFVQIFADSPDLHQYIVQRCYSMLTDAHFDAAACQIGVWCIGEFGDLLTGECLLDAPINATSSSVLDLLNSILIAPTSNIITREVALTAVMKSSARFPSEMGRIRTMIGSYADNLNVELQQRSTEYTMIFNQFNNMRPALLERMPVAELKVQLESQGDGQGDLLSQPAAPVAAPAAPSGGGDLLDLLGGDTSTVAAPAAAAPPSDGLADLLGIDLLGGGAPAQTAPPASSAGGLGDLLGDLSMGGGSQAAAPAAPSGGVGGDLMDLLGGGPVAAAPAASSGGLDDLLGGSMGAPQSGSGIPSITAWAKNGISVQFAFSKNPSMPSVLEILLSATNSNPSPAENFMFQIAVPKTHQLQMQAPSIPHIPPSNSGALTQKVLVNNPSKIPIRMRVKISYNCGGMVVDEMGEVSNFPPNAL